MDEEADTTLSIDEATLRYLARVLADQHEVSDTSLFPANKQEPLVITLNNEYYPDPVKEARLELRVYTSGDFHVSYIENYLGEIRRRRWDRHEQGHNERDHFHPLPAASATHAEDRDYPADVTRSLRTVVLPWVEDRLGEIREKE